MTNSSEPIPDDLVTELPPLGDLYADLNLEKAIGLARGGRYQEAESILDDLEKSAGSVSPQILDLRARICAQQGRLREAEAHWQAALKVKPGDATYQEGLNYVNGLQKPARQFPRLISSILVVLLAAVLLFLLWSTYQQVRDSNQTIHQMATFSAIEPVAQSVLATAEPNIIVITAQAPLAATPLPLNDLLSRMDGIQQGQEQILAQFKTPGSPLTLPDIPMDIRGVVIERQAQKMVLKFENGLFSYGWLLTKEGRTALTEVGQKLEPYSKQVRLVLVGYTSPDESQDDLFDLGLMRSVVVFTYFQQNSRLPEDMFTIIPQYGQPLPYNEMPENPQLNHTIMIWILPAQP